MRSRPIVIAGPCAAESYDLIKTVGTAMAALAKELDFEYVFKASFDKANRTSGGSGRGPGMDRALQWFSDLKEQLGVQILTDVHETWQCEPAAKVCDVLQIPAFLCRQTDLVVAAAHTGAIINVKKGQFMAPAAMANIVEKARVGSRDVWLTERGVSFGYGNLVVDMRSFPIMAATGAPLILDITHSTQLPATGSEGATSSGQRRFAPVLARAATATGHLAGYFLEAHRDPTCAISDKDAQLRIDQAEKLLRQLIPLWRASRQLAAIDGAFAD